MNERMTFQGEDGCADEQLSFMAERGERQGSYSNQPHIYSGTLGSIFFSLSLRVIDSYEHLSTLIRLFHNSYSEGTLCSCRNIINHGPVFSFIVRGADVGENVVCALAKKPISRNIFFAPRRLYYEPSSAPCVAQT